MAVLVKSNKWLTSVFDKRDYDAIFRRGAGKRSVVRNFRSLFRRMLDIWGRRNGSGFGSAWILSDPTWNIKPEIPLDSIGSYVRQDPNALLRIQKANVKKQESLVSAIRKKIGADKERREVNRTDRAGFDPKNAHVSRVPSCLYHAIRLVQKRQPCNLSTLLSSLGIGKVRLVCQLLGNK